MNTKNERVEIAKTIINQLGGNKFAMMTGAKNFVATESGVYFSIGRNASSINRVEVELNANDLYNIRFSRATKKTMKLLAEHADVYAEDMAAIFTDETGMHTKLF